MTLACSATAPLPDNLSHGRQRKVRTQAHLTQGHSTGQVPINCTPATATHVSAATRLRPESKSARLLLALYEPLESQVSGRRCIQPIDTGLRRQHHHSSTSHQHITGTSCQQRSFPCRHTCRGSGERDANEKKLGTVLNEEILRLFARRKSRRKRKKNKTRKINNKNQNLNQNHTRINKTPWMVLG